MKKLPVLMIVIFLLSSCTSTEVLPTQTPIPTSTPEFTKTPVPTATETPLPTVTPTATLAPFTVECIINDKTSTEKDCQLIRDAVDLGRHYLVNNFGRDITGTLQIKLLSEPNNLTGGHYGQGFTGGTNPADAINGIVEINTAHPFWAEYTSEENLYRHTEGVIHEFTHFWQLQHGCWKGDDLRDGILNFLNEGQAAYISDMAIGKPELINLGQSVVNWTHWNYDNTLWFNDTATAEVAFKDLMEQYSPVQYLSYCDLMLQGARPENAFQSVFGITIQEFRSQFKERTLGILKDCTQATCGSYGESQDAVDPVYGTLAAFIDHTITQPNLVINFTNDKGNPVHSHLLIRECKILLNDLFDCSFGSDALLNAQGQFIRPWKAGTYFLRMCEPGYPVGNYEEDPFKCIYSLKPFNVESDKTTKIDFQFHSILNPNLVEPNLVFDLVSEEGEPVPNQYLQVCSDGPVSQICFNSATDDHGTFKASLLEGKYTIRLAYPGQGYMDPRGYRDPKKGRNFAPFYLPIWEFEIPDIMIEIDKVSKLSYQYPSPNFVLHFEDAVGGPLSPGQVFWFCRDGDLPASIDGANPYTFVNEHTDMGDVGGKCFLLGQADKTGTFKAKLPLGTYHAYFNTFRHWGGENDYELADIHVTSKTEVTEITFWPK